MDKFPDLLRWFENSGYYIEDNCKRIDFTFKDNLTDELIEEFAREYAKYICRIRCNGPQRPFFDSDEDLCEKFQNVIDDRVILTEREKEFLRVSIFFEGMISQTKFNETNDFKGSIDRDGFNGYFGESLFYIIKEQYLEDEKIIVEPSLPKASAKGTGLDYMEIRRSNSSNDLYFTIGEIKTTKNGIGSYPNKIINQLIERPKHLYNSHINAFKEFARLSSDSELKEFVDTIPRYFWNPKITDKKRYAAIINHNYEENQRKNPFQDFQEAAADTINSNPECRRIKLVAIKNIENIKEKVLDYIWRNL